MRFRLMICAMTLPLTLFASACATDPHLAKPKLSIPDGWSKDLVAAPSGQVTFAEASAPVHWWRTFNDPILDNLIQRALDEGLDLKIAEARIKEARAQRSIVVSDFFPHTDIQAGATRTHLNANVDSLSVDGRTDMLTAALGASWEIDFFGRTRQAVRQASAGLAAQEETYRATGLMVIAEVARSYFEYRGAQARYTVLEQMLQSQKETLALVQNRQQAGTTAQVEVSLNEGLVNSTAAKLPEVRTAMQNATSSLAVLLAEPADDIRKRLEPKTEFPIQTFPVVVGVPSAILRDRPDIRGAEHAVEAAAAASGVAVADLFPRVSILGQNGRGDLDLPVLDTLTARYWTLGPSLHWPILDMGRIMGNIRVQRARHEQALREYEHTILLAFKDVEDAVVAYREGQIRQQQLNESVKNYTEALDSARSLYKAGVKDYLYVLEAQRQILAVQEAKTLGDTALALELTRLYKSLGGDWSGEIETGKPTQNK